MLPSERLSDVVIVFLKLDHLEVNIRTLQLFAQRSLFDGQALASNVLRLVSSLHYSSSLDVLVFRKIS